MEKWCTGIVADMKIDCAVRFEVSCQRERKREKKAALELYSDEYHSSKDFSCHFPFLFFKTMTFFLPWKFLIVFQRWLFLALNFFNGFWIVIIFFFIFSKSSVRKPKSIKYTHNLDPNVTTSGQKVVTLVLQQISQGQADTSPAVIQGPLILTTPPRPPQQTFASRLQGDWLKREFQNTPVPNVPAAKG